MTSTLPRHFIGFAVPAAPAAAERGFLRLGEPGLAVTSQGLERYGRPWQPVMAEFHYSRCPAGEWAAELRKLRAGGVDIVASYVMWNHHEAAEGVFDWSGQRDLRRFAQLAHEAGLLFYLRPGPWVHAEVRHGGLPDWLVEELDPRGALRSNDPAYLAHVHRFFGQIGAQLRGLAWRDGGPLVGLQLENEYDGRGPGRGAEHIAELKRLAIEAGLQVPLYTVTGWPTLDIPPQDVVPVSGAYADGFWGGSTGPQPPSGVFLFNTSRSIGEMGNVGGTSPEGLIDPAHYPFFLAEAGGGMHVSYHRRPVVTTDDVAACALVQLGSGANLYGYYMFHGGHNPGRGLQETQDTGYPNDVPEIDYDFHAPLGGYGQRRESYGRLRTLHHLMAAFGHEMATMSPVVAEGAPADPADRTTPRASLRGAGDAGFLFVNNHVRHHPMPAFDNVQFALRRADGCTQSVPSRPVAVDSGAYFVWPLGQRLGAAVMRHATAQPLTRWDEGGSVTWVGFALPGMPVELCFDGVGDLSLPEGWRREDHDVDSVLLHAAAHAALPCVLTLGDSAGQRHRVVLLDRTQADAASRHRLAGRERLVLCEHGVVQLDADTLSLDLPGHAPAHVGIFPADDLGGAPDAVLSLGQPLPEAPTPTARMTVLQAAQEPPAPREGPFVAWRGRSVPRPPLAEAYEAGMRVGIELDGAVPDQGRVMLDIGFIGDTAQLWADGVLVDDHFFDGEPWQVGVDRFVQREGAAARWPVLELRIVPIDPSLPIFLEDAARAALDSAAPLRAAVRWLSVTPWRSVRLQFEAGRGAQWQG